MRLLYTCARKTRNRLILNRIVYLELYLVLFFCIFSLPLVLIRQFRLVSFNTHVLPLLLILLTAGVIVYAFLGRKSLRGSIALLDSAAGLKARMISAFDQMEKGWTSPYAALIREDLERNARKFSYRRLFPVTFPRFAPALPFLAVITACLLIFQIPAHWFRHIDPFISGKASALEDVARKLILENKDNPDPGNLHLAEEMERLASEFRDLPMTRTDAREKLEALAEKMKDKENMARQQQFRIGETPPGIMKETEDALQMMDRNLLNQEDINDLERRMMDSPDIKPETKESLKKKFDDYEKNPDANAQQDLADEIRNELSDSSSDGNNSNSQGRNSQKLDELAKSMSDSDNPAGGTPPPDGNMTGDPGRETNGNNQGGKNNMPGTIDTPDTPSPFAPSHPDTVEQGTPEDRISNNSMVQSQVKNLPKISEKKVDAMDVDISYKKAIENNILKEEIPLSMREYIKDYFIGIGVLNENVPGEE
ncbi:MAG: hypothetical protein JW874_14805 [Spirochaetales bacterium]|nr:hypothetical protein [Spirochaetales bacterium]